MYFFPTYSFNDKLKVLMITDNLACGGKERRLISLIKQFSKLNFIDVDLALIDNERFYDDVPINPKRIHILGRKKKHDLSVFVKLYNLVKKTDPAIIHSWGSMPTIYALPAVKLLSKKILNAEIVNAPQTISFEQFIRTKLSFNLSDLIVSNSKAGITSYNAPKNKAICIYNGFDFDRLNNLMNKEVIRRKFNIQTRYVVGMVGAILPKKDYITFLIAAMDLCRIRNDISFMIVGEGEMLSQLKEMTKDFRNIVYTGKQHDVESIINIFDVGVLCTNSSIHGEGISNSIIEYMALGKPVIATFGGGTSEIIRDQVNGFICKPRNPNEIKNKIRFLIDNKSFAEEIGLKNKKLIEEKFSIKSMAELTIKAYERLLNKKYLQLVDMKNQINIPAAN
jgi:glycosyltransferase involved in cell wall biosynthesis